MFFVLSKILLFLLNPVNWILICLVTFFVTKRQRLKKVSLVTAIVLFILFSNYAIYRACMLAWQPKVEHKAHTKRYSAGIVLCGMTVCDKEGQVFFNGHADRFLQTARLYHTGVIDKVFISGGDGSLTQSRPRKEADFLREEFMALHVPDSAIIVEPYSRNTYESAVAAKHYLDSLKVGPPYLLITSAVHMPRSVITFNKAQLPVDTHPADYDAVESGMGWNDYLLPNMGVLHWWKPFLKEMVGVLVYKLTGKA